MQLILRRTFQRIKQHTLFKNTAWLLGTEITGKLARILTVLALAAYLDSVTYGVVMLSVACHDLFRITLKCGPGSQIVQCADADLRSFTRNGAGLQWILCSVLSFVQYLIAFVIGDFYSSHDVAFILQCLAPVYLFYPLTSSNVFLIQRANNMRYFSLWNGACITFENLVLALCLFLDLGIYSVIVTKYFGVVLWTVGFWLAPVKSYGTAFELHVFKTLFRTSSTLFLTEISKSLKGHADLFIAGKLLVPEIFGLYAFAKSVSIGLSQALINAFSNALYPHVCALHRDDKSQLARKQILLLTGAMALVLLTQAATAPIYVPMLFGESWNSSVQIVSVLCLASVGNLFFDIRCLSLRAAGRYVKELQEQLIFSAIATLTIILFAPQNASEMAWAVLLGATMWSVCYSVQLVCKQCQARFFIGLASLEKIK